MMPSSCPCYLHLHIPTTSFTSLDPWVSTPVACMSFNLSLFDLNPKGYPLLPKPFRPCLQAWLHRLAYLTLHFDTPIHDEGPSIYKQYLNYLYRTHPVSAIDKFSYECQDLLQAPLQPLMHELDMQTYDTFERDRVKYEQYQEAIAQALIDKKHVGKVIVLMVGMGARGPLVDCCLRASDRVNVPVFIYALEKNPNAIVTLSHKQKTVWGDELVKVVFADMRTWQPPVLADIMVSELLGSFGDNELCPECLDGAQKALKENAISIPQSYGSYVAPLSSTKLYFSALKVKDPSPLEMMYVVKFHEVQILEPSKKIWDFSHPLPPHQMLPKNQHNYRHSSIHYRMTKDAVVHGFAGFFDCTLYKNITLSIVPETHTKDMLSWFPAYFPIKQPIHLLQEDEITIHLWRCIGDKKVWYEWCLLATRQGKPLITSSSTIHNSTGKTYWIGL
ncbi:hypothetical protein HMI54_010483 [Coelomomyces lativittatus]|nr:hypothetical protein HMI54_010483 [Coelomomyces lativittatus]